MSYTLAEAEAEAKAKQKTKQRLFKTTRTPIKQCSALHIIYCSALEIEASEKDNKHRSLKVKRLLEEQQLNRVRWDRVGLGKGKMRHKIGRVGRGTYTLFMQIGTFLLLPMHLRAKFGSGSQIPVNANAGGNVSGGSSYLNSAHPSLLLIWKWYQTQKEKKTTAPAFYCNGYLFTSPAVWP